jgi:hypothetical protein
MTAVRRKQLQQLGHIRRDPPRLIFGEQLGRRGRPGGFTLKVVT